MSILIPWVVLLASGCDGNTTASYSTPPVLPIQVALSVDENGVWECSAGLWTPVGTFAIGHEFHTERRRSYVIVRDRDKGTDQVFKLAVAESLDIHATGEHVISLQPQRDKNKWVIETTTKSGTLEFTVRYAGKEISSVEFGKSNPGIGVTSDHRLIYKPRGWFSKNRELPIDSIDNIVYYRNVGTRQLRINWKTSIAEEPFVISLSKDQAIECGLNQLEASIAQTGARVQIVRKSDYWKTLIIGGLSGFIVCFIGRAVW